MGACDVSVCSLGALAEHALRSSGRTVMHVALSRMLIPPRTENYCRSHNDDTNLNDCRSCKQLSTSGASSTLHNLSNRLALLVHSHRCFIGEAYLFAMSGPETGALTKLAINAVNGPILSAEAGPACANKASKLHNMITSC